MSEPSEDAENKFNVALLRINDARKKLNEVEVEIPDYLEKEVKIAESRFKDAKGNKDVEGMQYAASYARAVLENVFIFCLYEAKKKLKLFKGSEILIGDDNTENLLDVHSKTLRKIEDIIDSNKALSGEQVSLRIEQLQKIFGDFGRIERKLSAAIREKEEEKREREKDRRISWISVGVGVAGVILGIVGIIIGSIIGPKECCNSCQQTDQPEAVVSGADNSTPNP